MSNYTFELRHFINDQGAQLFDFDYNFYNEEFKANFEEKFIDHYFFHEIGFETVERFKHSLRSKLNKIYPYYEQLYLTEVESKGITFLLNKDLTETFEREVSSDNKNESASTGSSSSNNDFKESSLENGNASLSLTSGSLTNVSNNNATGSSNQINISSGENSQNEKTTLVSKGNIGTTSSAQLLKEWRNVLINIDELIIEECRDLFMGVY